jgi:3-dehydroquinate synthase
MTGAQLIYTQNIAKTFSEFCLQQGIDQPIVLCDSNTAQLCLPLLKNSEIQLIEIQAGEKNKNFDSLVAVLNQMQALGMNTQSFLFNLGGGMVSDLGGFAASIYKRGVRYVNIPTSLLACADAAIGGKTGIDFNHLKNHIGAFNHPQAILFSSEFFSTLSQDEYRSGYAEIIKTAVMFDADLFENIQKNVPVDVLIQRCSKIKESVVQNDFKDQGERQKLNFGHNIGHALETYFLSINKPILHGLAVAKGMLFELDLAQQLNRIDERTKEKIKCLILERIKIEPIDIQEFNMLKPFLKSDKKNKNGKIVFSLPNKIGNGDYGIQMDEDEINF